MAEDLPTTTVAVAAAVAAAATRDSSMPLADHRAIPPGLRRVTEVTTSSAAAQRTGTASVTTVRTTLGPVPGVATSPPLGVSPILIGAIVIVIVAAAASGGYYMMQKGKKEGSKEEKIEEKKDL